MWTVMWCQWSHDFDLMTKAKSEVELIAVCEHYWQVPKAINLALKGNAPHLEVKWEHKTESVHQTVVYAGIGFFLAVKVKES